MIQRIQSVFLGIAALLNIGTYFTPIYDKAMQDPELWVGYGLALSLIFAVIADLASIFLYQNRALQMKMVRISSLFQVVALAFCFGVLLSLGGIGTYLWDEALGTALVFAGLILQILALRNIKKDEELVRSMDRIR